MNINKALLALALGFVLAVSTSANSQSTSQPMTREQAMAVLYGPGGGEQLQRQRQRQRPYVKDAVRLNDEVVIYILEDRRRNRLCYVTAKSDYRATNAISCGPLSPK